jgi:Zn-dependent protease
MSVSMSLSWKVGRVFGIDLYLHPTFLLPALFALAEGGLSMALTVAALFACVLLHEFGHALAARRYGIETEDITLYPIGGVARLRRLPKAAGPELVIALAGPAVNVAIVLLVASILFVWRGLLPELGPTLYSWCRELMIMNVVLAAFNLIPAFPMDGGRVLRALLSGRLGRLRATEIAARIGQGLALLFGFVSLRYGLTLWPQILLAAFVFFAASSELRHVRSEESRPSDDREDLFNPPPGYSWIYQGNGVWQLAPLGVGPDDRSRGPWL